MVAGVHALPVDALCPATTCMRAWSERSGLQVFAMRQRQACPAGTAIASMHALPLRPCRVCPAPATGDTPRRPNHVKSLSRSATSSSVRGRSISMLKSPAITKAAPLGGLAYGAAGCQRALADHLDVVR